MNDQVQTDRKSLMLDNATYGKISNLAKRAGVARPLVIEALLAVTDDTRLQAKLNEMRAEAKIEAAEERKKRAALSQLASGLDMAQIEALLKQLNV